MADMVTMGGYGIYVWSAYGVFALVLIADALAPLLQRRSTLRDLHARLKREAARKPS